MSSQTLPRKVALRWLKTAGYFSIGDEILYGKWKNKRGRIVAFSKDHWGNPVVEVEPIPKGRKKNKILNLFHFWRADVKEKALAKQAPLPEVASS